MGPKQTVPDFLPAEGLDVHPDVHDVPDPEGRDAQIAIDVGPPKEGMPC